RVADGVVPVPAFTAFGSVEVGHVAAAGGHRHVGDLPADRIHGRGAAGEPEGGVEKPGVAVGDVHRAGGTHGQSADGAVAVEVELGGGVEKRRQFGGEERLPLVTAQRRVVVEPVRVHGGLCLRGHDEGDVLPGE